MEMTTTDSGLKKLILFTAFFEGGAVMATELIGAKMIGPFYGNSLYVWTAVLAITLTGLGLGYFLGGLVSEKKEPVLKLYSILTCAAILLGMMPFIATVVMTGTMSLPIKTGITISCLVFLMPPLLCFGMISPLAIKVLTQSVEESGKTAGTVYAISTAGGIFFTFLAGFYTIPELGLKMSSFMFSATTLVFPLLFFIRKKKTARLATAMSTFFVVLILNNNILVNKAKADASYIKLITKSEGVLGQMVVADDLRAKTRSLFVNNISQSFIDENGRSKWSYIPKIASEFKQPGNKKVLIAGMGGGLLANELMARGISCDVVDLDHRMAGIASYFSKSIPEMITDDIRHYINSSKNRYDAVIFDISQSENQPSYVYTLECFSKVYSLLNEDGRIYVHFPSIYHAEGNSSVAAIYNTLKMAGFHTYFLPAKFSENKSTELIYAGFKKDPAALTGQYVKQEFNSTLYLTDDKPVLDKLHEETTGQLRRESLRIITATLLKEGYTIF